MENASGADVLDQRPANEWMKAGGDERPKMLFGELWKTGELCVMFGEPGVGKSLLAVQIADSIAKGRAVAPFAIERGARKVLYVDLEKTATQFKERYTAATENRSGRRGRHNFSKRFDRVSPLDGGYVRAADIARRIETSGARVVIIDNLPHMVRGGLPREAAAVMRELRRVRSAYGVSILVVANAARSTKRGGIEAADMAWAGTVASLADNIFAVGRCLAGGRYIKHIKPRSSINATAEDGSGEVARFRIERVKGTFPSFVHEGFGREAALRMGGDGHERSLMEQIRRMSEEENLSVRSIAAEIGMPKSTVHRYLQAARLSAAAEPAAAAAPKIFYALDACIDQLCAGCTFCAGRPGNVLRSTSGSVFGHTDCPDDCDICGPRVYGADDETDADVRRRSDEYFERLRAWLHDGKTGERPFYEGARRYGVEMAAWYPGSEGWPEEKVREFDRLSRRLGSHEAALNACLSSPVSGLSFEFAQREIHDKVPETRNEEPETEFGPVACPFIYDASERAEAWFLHLCRNYPERSPDAIIRDYAAGEEWCRPPGSRPPYDQENPFAEMELETDPYGHEIFIETRAETGLPAVWYRYDSKGILKKHIRDGLGIKIEKANPNLFGKWAAVGREALGTAA